MNKLSEIREDLKPIIEIKKAMDYQNCYDDGSGRFFKTTKKEAIEKGVTIIKKIIIDLAKKYKTEGV